MVFNQRYGVVNECTSNVIHTKGVREARVTLNFTPACYIPKREKTTSPHKFLK